MTLSTQEILTILEVTEGPKIYQNHYQNHSFPSPRQTA